MLRNKRSYKKCCTLIFISFFVSCTSLNAQLLNKYGLHVITAPREYKKSVRNDPAKKMLDLKQHIGGLTFDLKYTTAENITGRPLYQQLSTTYMRSQAVIQLSEVQKELNKTGHALKIWDAYRPYSVTEALWEPVKDERYAANPSKGSGHNRGIAIDLTIIDSTGKELDMGTAFDNFSDTAHHDFKFLSKQVIANRQLLKDLMEKNGFIALDTEWWHYYLKNSSRYELMNLPFSYLKKINK